MVLLKIKKKVINSELSLFTFAVVINFIIRHKYWKVATHVDVEIRKTKHLFMLSKFIVFY